MREKRGMNKRGDLESSKSVNWLLALLVLALIAAAIFLIPGLYNRLFGFAGGKSTIDSVNAYCNTACSSGLADNYCTNPQDLKFGRKIDFTNIKGKVAYGKVPPSAEDKELQEIMITCREIDKARSLPEFKDKITFTFSECNNICSSA